MAYKRKKVSYKRKRTYRKRTVNRSPGISHFSLTRKVYAGNWSFSTASTSGFWRYLQF